MSAAKLDSPQGAKLEKKFQCRLCDRMFTRSEHRARHELSHNPERPYKCSECSSTFVRRDLLIRHSRTVHGSTASVPPIRRVKTKSKSNISLDPGGPIHVNPNGSMQHNAQTSQNRPAYMTSANGTSSAASTHGSPAPNLLSLASMSTAAADVSTAMLMTQLHNHGFARPGERNSGGRPQAGPGDHGSLPPFVSQHDEYSNPSQHHDRGGGSGVHPSSTMPGGQQLPPLQSWSPLGQASPPDPKQAPQSGPPVWVADTQAQTVISNPSLKRTASDTNTAVLNEELGSIYKLFAEEDGLMIPFIRSHRALNGKSSSDHGQSSSTSIGSSSSGTSSGRAPEFANVPQLGPDFELEPLARILRPYPGSDLPFNFRLTKLQLDRYLSAYFNLFHPLVPMLHIQTFDCARAPPSLFFAICAVGALLCQEENVADLLSYNSRMLINMLHKPTPESARQLVTAQSLILIILYAAYSGDRAALETIGPLRSSLVSILDAVINASNLNSESRVDESQVTWFSWVSNQEIIRTYFCALIAITTLTAIFKYATTLSLDSMPQHLPLPCSEVLWNASFMDEQSWRAYLQADVAQVPTSTLGQLMRLISQAGEAEFEHMWHSSQGLPPLNPFSVRILGNIMFLTTTKTPLSPELAKMRMRQIQFWKMSAKDPCPGQGQSSLLSTASTSFMDFFEPLDGSLAGGMPASSFYLQAIRSQQHPMIILSHVLLGLTKLQLVLDLGLIRENLQFHGAHHVAEAAISCASMLDGDEKLESMISVVVACFDAMRVPLVLGVPMAQSFLSLPSSGSVTSQSLILGFELVIALVIWCHRVDERLNSKIVGARAAGLASRVRVAYSWIERTCVEAGHPKIEGQLAPTLANIAASSYEAVKTWRLATVMAAALRSLSQTLAKTAANANVNANDSYGDNYNEGPLSYEYLSYS